MRLKHVKSKTLKLQYKYVLSAMIMLVAHSMYAQTTPQSFWMYSTTGAPDISIKNYHTEAIPGSETGAIPTRRVETVMAGTMDVGNGNYGTFAHLLEFNNNTIMTRVSERHFSHSGLKFQVSDVVVDENNNYIVTCMARPTDYIGGSVPPYTAPAKNDRDYIVVFRARYRATSAILENIAIYENGPLPLNNDYGQSLYPVHSVYKTFFHNGTGRTEKWLYITGYYTPGNSRNTTITNIPGGGPTYSNDDVPIYASPKKIFVLALDMDPTSPLYKSVVHSIYVDYPAPGANYDFDMGMRLKALTDGSDNIAVTGSATALSGGSNPGNYSRSATLNLLLDHDLNIIVSSPFINNNTSELGIGDNEYGVDIVENQSGSGYNYIVGNIFDGLNTDVSSYGFDPTTPYSIFVAGLQTTGSFLNQRIHTTGNDDSWALQALPGGDGTFVNGSTDTRIMIAGMTSWGACAGGSFVDLPSATNINPMFLDVEVSSPSVQFRNSAYYNIEENQSGTGSYNTDGNGHHSIFWNPTFAVRPSTNELVHFNTPKALISPYASPSENGIKVMMEDVSANTLQNCGLTFCSRSFTNEMISSNNITAVDEVPNMRTADEPLSSTASNWGLWGYCNYPAPYDHKPANVGGPGMEAKPVVELFPNPAQGSIYLSDNNTIDDDAQVKVIMINIHGQVIAELYNNVASNMAEQQRLQIPAVASGIYMIHVYAGKELIHQQKLGVQQ